MREFQSSEVVAACYFYTPKLALASQTYSCCANVWDFFLSTWLVTWQCFCSIYDTCFRAKYDKFAMVTVHFVLYPLFHVSLDDHVAFFPVLSRNKRDHGFTGVFALPTFIRTLQTDLGF